MIDSCLPTAPLPSSQDTAASCAATRRQPLRIDGWRGLTLGPLLLVAVLLAAIWAGHGVYAERERNLAIRATFAHQASVLRLIEEDVVDALRAASVTPQATLPNPQAGSALPPFPAGSGLDSPLRALTTPEHDTVGDFALFDQTGQLLWQSPGWASAALPLKSALPSPQASTARLTHHTLRLPNGSLQLVTEAGLEANAFRLRLSRNLDDVLGLADARRSNMLGWGWSLTIALLAAAAVLAWIAHRQHRLYRELSRAGTENSLLISRLRDERSRAYQLASHDHLTGLPNRLLFTELANSHLSRARRSHVPFVMMFLDLDRFKRINDTLGHRIGDLLLKEVADRLSHAVRETDIVARLGGDEFVLLLTELDTVDDASRVARKLIDAIAQPMVIEGHDIEMRPSIGIAIHPRDGMDVEAMMRNADSAMYEAKRSGSGRFHYYDPSLNSRSSLQLDLSGRFRRAILGNEFVLHYQPRVTLNGFRVTSLEALIRWQHPERGLVPPGEFIDYAEQEGLVVELGNWVVREACRQIAAWLADGLEIVPVAINVSPKQLRDDSFVEVIRESVAHYGIRPELLEIEITERCVVEDFKRPRTALETLSALGLKIALDDYGTGFSSLSYLKRLPIDIIKIDRSFISDIRNQTNDAAIVASTIALGHNLGLTVIAEGVETREQLIYLRTAGCDEVQGYYFQKPAPADAIRPLLEPAGKHLSAFA